jgi:nicotinate dehydrogenase subunit A
MLPRFRRGSLRLVFPGARILPLADEAKNCEQVYDLKNQIYSFSRTVIDRGFLMAVIRLSINGNPYAVEADPQTSLLTVLRDHLDLTGSKYGCGEGQCGACTVLLDGKAQRSCITRVGTIGAKQITTIEGLAAADQLHPVQQAFLDEEAMQCAYCTSGMIMSAVSLLAVNRHPTRDEIIDSMEGNICRCGTYSRIVSAIQKAAAVLAEAGAAKGASR